MARRSCGLALRRSSPSWVISLTRRCTDCRVSPILRAICEIVSGTGESATAPSTCQRALVSPSDATSASPAAKSRPLRRKISRMRAVSAAVASLIVSILTLLSACCQSPLRKAKDRGDKARSFTLLSRGSPRLPLAQHTNFRSIRLQSGGPMPTQLVKARCLAATSLFLAALPVLTTAATAAPCEGPGAPANTQTRCLTAIAIPGNPLRAFDISFANPDRGEYYLADRSNAGVDVIDTVSLTFKRRLGGFVGVAIVPGSITPANPHGNTDNGVSGPDGVTNHGRWLYAGDGDSTVKVFDLEAPAAAALKQAVSSGGVARVDEMALTTDGTLLFAANNADDPPFGTFFQANG